MSGGWKKLAICTRQPMADLAGFDVAAHAMVSITGYVCWRCIQLWGAASHDSYIKMTCNMTTYGSDRLMV